MYKATEIPPGNKPIDPRADPKYFDYTWTNWLDIIDPKTVNEILEEEGHTYSNSTEEFPIISEMDTNVEILLVWIWKADHLK